MGGWDRTWGVGVGRILNELTGKRWGLFMVREKLGPNKTPRRLQGWTKLRLLEMRNMKPELVILCDQERLPVELLGQQPNHITLNLQSVQSMAMLRYNGTEILGVVNQWLVQNEIYTRRVNPPLHCLEHRPRGCMTQRYSWRKNVNIMMFNDIMLYS